MFLILFQSRQQCTADYCIPPPPPPPPPHCIKLCMRRGMPIRCCAVRVSACILKVRQESEDVTSRPLRSIIVLAQERSFCSFAAWRWARIRAHACVSGPAASPRTHPADVAVRSTSCAVVGCVSACEERRGGREERRARSVVEWRVEHAGSQVPCAPSAAAAVWAASAAVSALIPEEEEEEMTLPHLYHTLRLLLLSYGPRLAPLRSVISWTSPASEVLYANVRMTLTVCCFMICLFHGSPTVWQEVCVSTSCQPHFHVQKLIDSRLKHAVILMTFCLSCSLPLSLSLIRSLFLFCDVCVVKLCLWSLKLVSSDIISKCFDWCGFTVVLSTVTI